MQTIQNIQNKQYINFVLLFFRFVVLLCFIFTIFIAFFHNSQITRGRTSTRGASPVPTSQRQGQSLTIVASSCALICSDISHGSVFYLGLLPLKCSVLLGRLFGLEPHNLGSGGVRGLTVVKVIKLFFHGARDFYYLPFGATPSLIPG